MRRTGTCSLEWRDNESLYSSTVYIICDEYDAPQYTAEGLRPILLTILLLTTFL